MKSDTIEVYEGNTHTFTVTVLNNGVAFPLTGYTCNFTVKQTPTSASADIDLDAPVSGIASNVVTFNLSSADTNLTPGTYWYEVNISNTGFAYTALQGVFLVKNSLII